MYIELLRLEKTICRWRLSSIQDVEAGKPRATSLSVSAGTAAMDGTPSVLRPERHL